MCPTTAVDNLSPAADGEYWRREMIESGSLRHVDLHTGSNGWASPPGDLFNLRARNYFSCRHKSPSGEWLLKPAGVDLLRSTSRLDDVLGRPDNRIAAALRRAQSAGRAPRKAFLVAVNLQIPGRECYSIVFYFVSDGPINPSSLLGRFIYGDDNFRNSRFKIVNRIIKGPWIVKAAVGSYAACLLGKALTCRYHSGENYLEIDVDIGSSTIANAVLRLALGHVTAVTIDMGFMVEAQAEDELPEKLFGAVRVAQMEMSAAKFVEARPRTAAVELSRSAFRGLGTANAKVNHHGDGSARGQTTAAAADNDEVERR